MQSLTACLDGYSSDISELAVHYTSECMLNYLYRLKYQLRDVLTPSFVHSRSFCTA